MVASILNEICDQRRKDVVVAKEQVGPARVPAPRAAPRACGGACWGGPPASGTDACVLLRRAQRASRAHVCGAASGACRQHACGATAVGGMGLRARSPPHLAWCAARVGR